MSPFAIIRCVGALLIVAQAAGAWSETIPVPRQKPARAAGNPAEPIPVPRPNPRRQQVAPPIADTEPMPDGKGWTDAEVDAALRACRETLAGLDIGYTPQAPLGASGGCGAPAPILLSRVGAVSFTPPAIVTCDLAAGIHSWMTRSVQPAARRRLKTEVSEVRVAASYVCRRRNNQAGGKLSEHGRANALDMSGFGFAKSKDVTVGDGWGGILGSIGLSSGGSFLNDIQKEACADFTTVLGPGSDSYHGNHFHVDVLKRKGGYRICQ